MRFEVDLRWSAEGGEEAVWDGDGAVKREVVRCNATRAELCSRLQRDAFSTEHSAVLATICALTELCHHRHGLHTYQEHSFAAVS